MLQGSWRHVFVGIGLYMFILVSHEELTYFLVGKSILKGEIKLDDKRNMDEYSNFV